MPIHSVILWIQSPQKEDEIFTCVRQLVAQHIPLTQVFFYFEGVQLLARPTFLKRWYELRSEAQLYACQHYVEKEKIVLPPKVQKKSLVDFFVQHWHDQGQLLQF